MSEPGTLPCCPSFTSDSHMCIPSPAATCAPLPKLLRASGYFPASVPFSLWILPIGISREAGRTQIQSHPPTSAEKLAGAPCCVCVADKKTSREFTGSEQKHTPLNVWPGSWRIRSLPASFCTTFPCLLCCRSLQLISEFSNKQYSFLRPHLSVHSLPGLASFFQESVNVTSREEPPLVFTRHLT